MSKKLTTEEFIERAKLVHGDKYDYSLTEYKSAHDTINAICEKHGEFYQKAYSHLSGKGCDKCGGTQKYTNETFIAKSKEKHGNKYDYSLVNYTLAHNRVKIICPEHGEFNQLPYTHIQGFGCYQCADSKGEREIKNFLIKQNIVFESQKTFDGCKDKRLLKFDFYLPSLNLCIEYDGEQHFYPIKRFGGKNAFRETKKRDKIKTEYCFNNNIQLIRISYKENINQILNNYFVGS